MAIGSSTGAGVGKPDRGTNGSREGGGGSGDGRLDWGVSLIVVGPGFGSIPTRGGAGVDVL